MTGSGLDRLRLKIAYSWMLLCLRKSLGMAKKGLNFHKDGMEFL